MIRKLLVLSTITASSLFATNGVNLIGTGTVSRSMGGTGVAYYSHAVEAIHRNPALMANTGEKTEFQMDYTFFNATVSGSQNFNGALFDAADLVGVDLVQAMNEVRMSNGKNVSKPHYDAVNLGNIGAVWRINDKWTFGLAFIGAAGLGVDNVESVPLRKFKTGLMFAKLIPALSYETEKVNFGFAPVIGFGSMSMNYDEDGVPDTGGKKIFYDKENPDRYYYDIEQSQRQGLFGTNIGGPELVPGLGFEVGMEIKITDKLTFGQTYQSAISFTYKDVANFEQFGIDGLLTTANDAALRKGLGLDRDNALIKDSYTAVGTGADQLDDLELEQPWELAFGLAYEMMKELSVTADYRHIAWASAAGYQDFGWTNQNVYAIGFDYHKKHWSLRAGYNYSASPVLEIDAEQGLTTTDVQGHSVFKQARTMLSTIGFPAIATTHFSIGGAYNFSKNLTVDMALVHSPEVKYTATGFLASANGGYLDYLEPVTGPLPDFGNKEVGLVGYEYTATMSQTSFSFGVNYLF